MSKKKKKMFYESWMFKHMFGTKFGQRIIRQALNIVNKFTDRDIIVRPSKIVRNGLVEEVSYSMQRRIRWYDVLLRWLLVILVVSCIWYSMPTTLNYLAFMPIVQIIVGIFYVFVVLMITGYYLSYTICAVYGYYLYELDDMLCHTRQKREVDLILQDKSFIDKDGNLIKPFIPNKFDRDLDDGLWVNVFSPGNDVNEYIYVDNMLHDDWYADKYIGLQITYCEFPTNITDKKVLAGLDFAKRAFGSNLGFDPYAQAKYLRIRPKYQFKHGKGWARKGVWVKDSFAKKEAE